MFLGNRFATPRDCYFARRLLNTTTEPDTWGSLAFALLEWNSSGSFDADVATLEPSAE